MILYFHRKMTIVVLLQQEDKANPIYAFAIQQCPNTTPKRALPKTPFNAYRLFSYSFYISPGSSPCLIGEKPCMFCKEARV